MSKITNIELQNSTEYFTALFIGSDGKVYDIVFTRNIEMNIGWEGVELLSIQNRGENVEDEILWEEIKELLAETSLDGPSDDVVQVSVRIEREWLEILDSLFKLVLADSQSSPEGALEAAIFSQIQQQLGMR